jgi:hypothetical protein
VGAVATEACIAEIEKAAAGALSRDAILESLDDIEKRFAKRARRNPLESKTEASKAIGEELSREAKIAAIIEKRTRTIAVLRKQSRWERINANEKDKIAALGAMIDGRGSRKLGGGFGSGESTDAIGKSLTGHLVNPMFGELERKGLIKLFRDPDFEEQVVVEIWRLTEPDNPTLPAKTRAEAVEAAKIIGRTTEAGRKMQNEAGAWIGRLPGYVMRQDHDMLRIRRASLDVWKADMLALLDPEKTFDDPTDAAGVDKMLNRTYAALQTGVHEGMRGADDWLGGFKGPSNLGKKVSQHRTLNFKGPKEMMAYHRKYGLGTLLESINNDLEHAARNTALMRVWGPNPEAAFHADLDQITKQAARAGDTATTDAARASASLESRFAQVNGTANIGGNPTVAAVGSFIRGWQSLVSLGQITVSAMTDIPITAGTLRQSGFGYFEGVSQQLGSLLEGRTTAEAKEILQHLDILMDGTVGEFGSRFTSADGARGLMARSLQTFFKYNGIRWWTDRMKAGVGLGLSNRLAMLSGKSFDQLDELLQRNLGRYRIGAREWDLIRSVEHEKGRGKAFLTSDGVNKLSDEQITAYLGKPDAKPGTIRAAREDLRTRLSTYFTDQVDEAVNQPGSYERYLTSGGKPSGTFWGEAVRAFMQFKGFGLSVSRRHFGRELYRAGQIDKAGFAYLILGTTTMGYVAMTAKQLLAGKTPQDPQSVPDALAIAGAAFVQGGGAGIYGDFLFGDFDRYGRGAVATLGGPLVGKAEDLLRLKSLVFNTDNIEKTAGGEVPRDLAAQLVNLGRQNLPLQNFIGLKTALDYMVFYRMQEWMSPGYLARMQKRAKKERGQTFWLKPTG